MSDVKDTPTVVSHDDRISNIAREHCRAVDRCDAYRYYADELHAVLEAERSARAAENARWSKHWRDARYRARVLARKLEQAERIITAARAVRDWRRGKEFAPMPVCDLADVIDECDGAVEAAEKEGA